MESRRPKWGGGFLLIAFPLLMESEAELFDFDLTRFLHANRCHFARKRYAQNSFEKM
jgi:hypothetical protein